MEPLILQADSEDAGKRLDAWLAEQTELTRSAAQNNYDMLTSHRECGFLYLEN